MNKKYIVELSVKERAILDDVIARLSGSSQKACRTSILRQNDIGGAGWTDEQIAQGYHYRIRTIEKLRKNLVEQSFDVALKGLLRIRKTGNLLQVVQNQKLYGARRSSSFQVVQ